MIKKCNLYILAYPVKQFCFCLFSLHFPPPSPGGGGGAVWEASCSTFLLSVARASVYVYVKIFYPVHQTTLAEMVVVMF